MAGNNRRPAGRGSYGNGKIKQAYRRDDEYVYGNAVRALNPVRVEKPAPRLSHTVRRNRDRAAKMNPGWVLFLTVAMMATGTALIFYLRLQSDITNRVKNIAVLEAQYNTLKAENDDTESRIKGTVDLENIKHRAMTELGMQYANENQIVSYETDDDDYVRQYIDLK